MRTCAILERTSCAGAAPLRISQRRVPRFPNDPVLRRCAFNRCSILDTAADSKTTDAARDPSSRQRGHREGADKEGTLAAMKALWRELADPTIKEHHGPVVKTTRLAAIESRKGRLSSSVAPKRSGPSGPGAGTCFQPGSPASGDSGCPQLCCGRPSNY